MITRVVGIDCATRPNKMGVTLAEKNGPRWQVLRAERSTHNLAEMIHGLLPPSPDSAIIALDSPLGWPIALGEALVAHRAGEILRGEPDDLFHRRTDDFVRQSTGKRPLEVGADRIARTAHSTLAVLAELSHLLEMSKRRIQTCHFLPVAIQDGALLAIEVYPAATLLTQCSLVGGYKVAKSDSLKDVVSYLKSIFDFEVHMDSILSSPDVLDSVICAASAVRFMNGECHIPEADLVEFVSKEGWICFPRKKRTAHN